MGNNLMYVNICKFVVYPRMKGKNDTIDSLLLVYTRLKILTVNACH